MESSQLIELIGTVAIPARTEKFVARSNFVVNTKEGARVKIFGLSKAFKENFLDKIEEPSTKTILHYGRLLKISQDGKIVAEIGGKGKAKTALAEIFYAIQKQANGEAGDLIIEGHWVNIFYTYEDGLFWMISVKWTGKGWYIDARSHLYTPEYHYVGDRVFQPHLLKS